jgi:hypothetical protein
MIRTLVLGLPLPHTAFDNYSFLSAPSLFDYTRIIVDMTAVSDAVEQVVSDTQEHSTFGRQRIVNGPGGHASFSLAELLRLRRLEAQRLFDRGGDLVCLAYPDVRHEGIEGLPGWRRYDWLPAPEGASYAELLLAGHGKLGVDVADEGHAFAAYAQQFGVRLGFRAYLVEGPDGPPPFASVFARSPGGAAVGFELTVGGGRAVFLPPLADLDYDRDRAPLANVLAGCLDRLQGEQPDQPSQWMRKEAS